MASAEPAAPEVREHMNLPPKSFADALAADKSSLESGATGAEPAAPEVREHMNLPPKSFADALATDKPSSDSGAIGAEPAAPEVRERMNLPPKSFADALAADRPSSESGATSESSDTKVNGESYGGEDYGEPDGEKTVKRKASVLKIVDTHPEDPEENENKPLIDSPKGERTTFKKSKKEAKKEKKEKEVESKQKPEKVEMEKPTLDRQESKHEYSATGLDDTAKIPPRVKHRKQKSSSDRSSRSPISNSAESNPGPTNEENTERFEKYEDRQNGSRLVSVKAAPEFEKSLKRDSPENRPRGRDRRLASGRQAGKRWETSAIRWAPLNVPLQRRLQTLVVLFHTLCIPLFISSFFFLCAIPLFWPLLIPYMIYCMFSQASTSGTLSHRSNFLRSLPHWSLFASYFPARLHRSEELSPTRKYIFGYHPHGIISHGAFAAFGTEALGFSQLFPGITNTLLTLESNFRVPLYRDYALAMGLASVSKESCENILSKGGVNGEGMGRAITIVIGGARESLDAQPYSLRLVLKRRKGFVKMAIKTGADLVPVLAFGENDLYDQVTSASHPTIYKMQLLMKKILGFTIPLFHARGVFNYDVGLMPYRRPLNIVVGRPVQVRQADHPEQEDIDRAHEEYVAELERLWDLWKDDFAKDRVDELEILE